MLRSVLCALILFLSLPQAAAASDAIRSSVPNAQIVGEGVLTYAFWDVYRATLYAPDGVWAAQKPFALSIEYFRHLKGKAIADRSVQEMRGQGFKDEVLLATWHARMKSIFPDVQKGTVLSAIYLPGSETVFYRDGNKIGAIEDDDFGQRFFSIWLDKKTSEPQLRRALLGEK